MGGRRRHSAKLNAFQVYEGSWEGGIETVSGKHTHLHINTHPQAVIAWPCSYWNLLLLILLVLLEILPLSFFDFLCVTSAAAEWGGVLKHIRCAEPWTPSPSVPPLGVCFPLSPVLVIDIMRRVGGHAAQIVQNKQWGQSPNCDRRPLPICDASVIEAAMEVVELYFLSPFCFN